MKSAATTGGSSLPRDVLLDAGPLIALIDARDPWHERAREIFHRVIRRCLTTEAVVTEACHFAGRSGLMVRPLELLLGARVPIVPLDARLHSRVAMLMRRYADIPMDYADATLVAVGDALGASTAFTTDRRGFGTYRGARGMAFDLLP